ncbi:hypothetical protein DFJ68_1891 [Terracoccus luteus]|uniref:WD40 repeat protein n=2 Tax=Terracoccus luteus TaxID=53356 RepID=A0A495XZ52_9MICO|nr:hypothetical protein [Terracoccus luteus]RKT78445.1 hypothetical protein DFJ68_1891 [Terracoccus luteus]
MSIMSTRKRRRAGVAVAALAGVGLVAPAAIAAVSPPDDGVTTLVSKAPDGSWGDKTSTRARISGDGRFVVYQSAAQNLTTNRGGGPHVYLTDVSGTLFPGGNNTRLVDADATTGARCKTKAGTNGQSTFNEVSNQRGGDGPWVVFASNCSNLVPGWTHVGDVYIRNMRSGETRVVSQANGNDGATIDGVSTRPVISDDGRYVSWNTTSGNIYVRDMSDTSNRRSVRVAASVSNNDESLRPEISGDGSTIVFASDARLSPKDTNDSRNIYRVDLSRWQADKSVTSFTYELVDVTSAGIAAPRPSSRPGINDDGSIISFQSSTNLVADDKNGVLDSYWRNMRTGQTVLLSRGYDGGVPKGQSSRPQLDGSGYVAAFTSTSNGLVRGDTNGRPDAFIRVMDRSDPTKGTTYVISQRPNGDTAGALDNCAEPAGAAARTAQPVTRAAGIGLDDTILTPFARPGKSNVATRPYLSSDAGRVVFVSGMCDLVNPVTDGADNQIYVRTYGAGGPR